MARTYKAYEESFMGFIIKPIIEQRDAEGFGQPKAWIAERAGKVEFNESRVSSLRQRIRTHVKQNKRTYDKATANA